MNGESINVNDASWRWIKFERGSFSGQSGFLLKWNELWDKNIE